MRFPAHTPSVSPTAVGPVIKTLHIGNELAIDLGDSVLVASCSAPDSWHEIRDGRCTCKGFAFRNTCRHLAVADQARMMGIEETPICPACHEPTADVLHCGYIACPSNQPRTPESRVPTGKAALAFMQLADD